jgi:ABC-type transporter Mla subunit MlaD
MPDEYSPPRRFAGADRKVSRFFLAALTGIFGVILLVSYKQGLFIPHTPLYFYAADAIGINKGMTVKLFGLQIGTVKNMEISDRGVKVELSIVNDYIPRIPKGSQARLARESYVGGANLQIVPSTDPARATNPMVAGDEIEFVPGRTIAEIIDDLKSQVTPLIGDLRGMLADINRPDSDYRKSAAAARELLEQLPATSRDAHKLIRDADHAVQTAESTFSSVTRVSNQAEQQLPVLTGKIATSLDSLNAAAIEIRDAARKNGEALHETLRQTPGLVRDSGDLVRDSQEIVTGVKNAWPVRDLIEAPATHTLPVDSFESTAARGVAAAPVQRQ